MEPGSEARRLIAEAKGLILDFDGPMCDVFAGTPASVVAEEFRNHVDRTDFVSDDPLAVLDAVGQAGGDLDEAHRWLTAREVRVVEAAIETPGLRHLVEQFDGPVAVASNNAAPAITRWLNLNGLASSVAHIEGRDPNTMKPHPRSLVAAARALGLATQQCCFVGDSLSDGVAAQECGVRFIGLANGRPKANRFAAAGFKVLVPRLDDLID